MTQLLWLAGTSLFLIGLAGALVRRSLLVTTVGILLSLLGAALVLLATSSPDDVEAGASRALVLLVLGACHAGLASAVTLAIFRRRGTVQLDELRELQG